MATNYKKLYAMRKANEQRILKICPEATHESGIYCFYRISEDGFKFAYVGQATTSLLTRLAQHLSGYRHIDLSIKKHGLYDEGKNPYGYKISILCHCPARECDDKEQYYIKKAADAGYQLRNSTTGSQGKGKKGLENQRAHKGYRDGVTQGYKNAQKEIKHLFDLHLNVSCKKEPPTKMQLKALEKFNEFISESEDKE